MFGKQRNQPSGRKISQPQARQSVRANMPDRRTTSAYSYYSGNRTNSGTVPHHTTTERAPAESNAAALSGSRHWRNLPSYAALCAVIAGVLFTLSLSSTPRVVVEQVDGVTLTRSTDEYANQTLRMWQDSWQTKTTFTLNTDAVREDIKATYTELSDVRVQVPLLGRRPTIVLVPSRAALKLQAQNGTYFLDSQGRALIDATVVDQGAAVPTVRDQSEVAVEPGKTILPSEHVAYLLQLSAQLTAEKQTGELSLSSGVVNQVEFRPSDQDYLVKFLLDNPDTVRQAVGSYIAVKSRLTGQGKQPTTYIDVRIPEKVFYK